MNDPAFALALAFVVALVYLVVLRLIDLNEKEPLWALALALVLGAIGAAITGAIIDPDFRELDSFGEAITSEGTKFVAIAAAIAMLEGVSRMRGWSEVNGLVDGIIYGAAVGLGFAVGEAFVRELEIGSTLANQFDERSTLTTLWTTFVDGLSEGLFGAIIGAAFGAALAARSAATRFLYPLVGLALAFIVHAGYEEFAHGNSLDSDQGFLRSLIALLLPIAFIAFLMIQGLARERKAIAHELADESEGGAVSEEELKLLSSPGARRKQYIGQITKGNFDGWLTSRSLHNRQVQLALAERRMRTTSNEERKQEIGAEVHHLRASILDMKGAR